MRGKGGRDRDGLRLSFCKAYGRRPACGLSHGKSAGLALEHIQIVGESAPDRMQPLHWSPADGTDDFDSLDGVFAHSKSSMLAVTPALTQVNGTAPRIPPGNSHMPHHRPSRARRTAGPSEFLTNGEAGPARESLNRRAMVTMAGPAGSDGYSRAAELIDALSFETRDLDQCV
jgi:hypothetical protein